MPIFQLTLIAFYSVIAVAAIVLLQVFVRICRSLEDIATSLRKQPLR